MAKHILNANNLTKRYGHKVAVSNVSLTVQSNEIVGLLGPNGAGKSTCFSMLAGLLKADSGNILLDSKDITNLAMHLRSLSGLTYLPQEPSIFRELSTQDNLKALIEYRKDLGPGQKIDLCHKLLEEFGLIEIKSVLGRNLSGGERRRLEIARTLTSDPKFILLDEPFAGIDPISLSDVKTQIDNLKKRKIGILITDHNVRETLDICDRAYIVNEGTTIAEGNIDAVLNNKKVKSVYLGENYLF